MEFVLVHGTTQSPAGWDPLRDALARNGHTSAVVDLVGDHPEMTVDDYAQLAAAQVGRHGDGRVVVAHSGAGALLPELAGPLGAEALVWLAAYVPDFTAGRSLLDEFEAESRELFQPDWLGADPFQDHQVALRLLFHDCSEEIGRWALGTLRPFAPQALYTHTPAPEPPTVASMCVVPANDRTLRPEWLRRAAVQRLGVRPVEIDAGHCPHVSRPEGTAEVLERCGIGPPSDRAN